MNKRAVILLLICFVLGAATVTLRYIERERERIKAQFVPPPRVEPKRERSLTTTVYAPPVQTSVGEGGAAGEPPVGGSPLQAGQVPPEKRRDTAQDGMPLGSEPGQRLEGDALQQPALSPLQGEEALQDSDGVSEEAVVTPLEDDVVTPLEDPVVTPLEDEVLVPSASGSREEEADTLAETEEGGAGEGEAADGESERAAGPDDEVEGEVFPDPASEIGSGKDEQNFPDQAGEEGEYLEGSEEGEPFEEFFDDQQEEFADDGEGEGVLPFEGEELPSDEESSVEEGEELFFDEEE